MFDAYFLSTSGRVHSAHVNSFPLYSSVGIYAAGWTHGFIGVSV